MNCTCPPDRISILCSQHGDPRLSNVTPKGDLNLSDRLNAERDEARDKAIDSLARYKFTMFGYWASIWVHLNRLIGDKQPNPFAALVAEARKVIS